MTPRAAQPVLAADIRSFSYEGAAPVLRGVGLELPPGSLTAVLGGSGSGTSTLAKLLSGWAVSGGHGVFDGTLALRPAGSRECTTLEFRGSPDDPRLRLGAWGQHVAYVPQRATDLLTGAAQTVGEELAFALEQRGMPREQMRHRVDEAARAVGLSAHLGRHPAQLSGGEQRRLALGCALVGRPSVMVLDDPSASLDAAGRADLGQLIDTLRAAATAVVVVGTCADRLARRADHWVLLAAGTPAAQGPPEHVLATEAFRLSGVLPQDPADAAPNAPSQRSAAGSASVGALSATAPAAAAIAELAAVSFAYPGAPSWVLDHADLGVRPGEVVALAGPNGAGKSTALKHFAGIARPIRGTVRIAGQDIARVPAGRVADTVGTLFQDPRDQLFARSVLREVEFGLRLGPRDRARRSRAEVRRRALAALDDVGLGSRAGEHPYDLTASGQRLTALAAVIARGPRVLLLDEPTVGLDRHGLACLERLVASAAESGAAVVLSTHAAAWARARADRTMAIADGRFVAG